jgi:hypothetical protein
VSKFSFLNPVPRVFEIYHAVLCISGVNLLYSPESLRASAQFL